MISKPLFVAQTWPHLMNLDLDYDLCEETAVEDCINPELLELYIMNEENEL